MPIQRRIVTTSVVIIALGVLASLGYRYWYQPTYNYFNTDDATVSGSLVDVAAPASGQIESLFFDRGTSVQKDQVLATIKVVATAPPSSAGPSVPRVLARVTSPISGTVAVRSVSVGDTIATGQPIATIVNLGQLWVQVNVDENRIGDIKTGQVADVDLGDVNHVFRGTVAELGSATNDLVNPTANLLGGSSTDTTQKVPVKVVFDYSGYRLVPGMGANVTIYTSGPPK